MKTRMTYRVELTPLFRKNLRRYRSMRKQIQQQQRQTTPQRRLSVAGIRAEARRRTKLLREVPRAEIVSRFRELTEEEIRQEAIAKGTAIEGDWRRD